MFCMEFFLEIFFLGFCSVFGHAVRFRANFQISADVLDVRSSPSTSSQNGRRLAGIRVAENDGNSSFGQVLINSRKSPYKDIRY